MACYPRKKPSSTGGQLSKKENFKHKFCLRIRRITVRTFNGKRRAFPNGEPMQVRRQHPKKNGEKERCRQKCGTKKKYTGAKGNV